MGVGMDYEFLATMLALIALALGTGVFTLFRAAVKEYRNVVELRKELERAHYAQDAAMHEAEYWRQKFGGARAENTQLRSRVDALLVELEELRSAIR